MKPASHDMNSEMWDLPLFWKIKHIFLVVWCMWLGAIVLAEGGGGWW
jgi:hypothetical protein